MYTQSISILKINILKQIKRNEHLQQNIIANIEY